MEQPEDFMKKESQSLLIEESHLQPETGLLLQNQSVFN